MKHRVFGITQTHFFNFIKMIIQTENMEGMKEWNWRFSLYET